MITVITGIYPIYKNGIDTGRTEFVASHGIDSLGRTVILQCVHPAELGAIYLQSINEWVILDKGEVK
jgi:hypothetical protein